MKKEKEIFLKMLQSWKDGPFKQLDQASIRTLKHFPILEIFISLYLKELIGLTRCGLARSYIFFEENLKLWKGKLLFGDNLRHNFVRRERFYMRYARLSPDRPINRLIKSSLLRLSFLSRDEQNQKYIRQICFHFDNISESQKYPKRSESCQDRPKYVYLCKNLPLVKAISTKQQPWSPGMVLT